MDTTAVTNYSNVTLLQYSDSQTGTNLGVTYNSNLTTLGITAKAAGTSFTITSGATPSTNPFCIGYHIKN